ncbi:Flp family type IVb pilin [Nocardioides stalactiti]|uniref:Flp family type IVb pilin n=1 Tax=Nocardioides stalactiti TaxID=2755356 RepID=UPI0016005670|nr:Flp family type IVb pilin [Nocardioides stalactiti]
MQRSSLRPARPEDGGSAVEYGVLISAIVLVIVAIITLFGTQVSDLYANVF